MAVQGNVYQGPIQQAMLPFIPAQAQAQDERAEKVYRFEEQLEVSHKAEDLFLRYMMARKEAGKLRHVEDVRQDPTYYPQDIDFICTEVSGKRVTYEVKNDTTTTGNLFAEFAVNAYGENEGNVQHCRTDKGWLYKSCADRIFYYFEKEGTAYIFDRAQFAAWVDGLFAPQNLYGNGERTRPPMVRAAKNVRTNADSANDYYYGIGYIIPLREMKKASKLQGHLWVLQFGEKAECRGA